jgi:hypothetical protein
VKILVMMGAGGKRKESDFDGVMIWENVGSWILEVRFRRDAEGSAIGV